ncbi:MAG TPA: hypothetical protein VH255_08040, partial [Verrucomicrobiae bacterium]|nr:hypothetical protein [Verrucomicrobiae bacterium]
LGVEDSNVFFGLTALNAVVLTGILLTQPDNRLVRQLLFVVFSVLVAAIPQGFIAPVSDQFSRDKLIGIVSATYLLLAAAISRNPKIGIAGMLAAACAGGALRGGHPDAFHWAAQTGMAFFLLHSLRWKDEEHPGASGVRITMAILWTFHAMIWVGIGTAFWHPLLFAVVVLAGYSIRVFFTYDWAPRIVAVASVLVAASSPVYLAMTKVQAAPVGILAISGSFVLFAMGTAAALTKHQWHKHTEAQPVEKL